MRDFIPDFVKKTKTIKKRVTTFVEIKFVRLGTIVYHLSEAVLKAVPMRQYFEKNLPGEDKGKIIVNKQSPVTFSYNCKSNQLDFQAKYNILNHYGNACI